MNAIQTERAPLWKRTSVISALLALTVAAFLLTGCIKLIGDYDDTFDKGITDVQQKAELYFAKLQSDPSTPMTKASTTT